MYRFLQFTTKEFKPQTLYPTNIYIHYYYIPQTLLHDTGVDRNSLTYKKEVKLQHLSHFPIIRNQNETQCKGTNYPVLSTAGVSNLQHAGQIWPMKPYDLACGSLTNPVCSQSYARAGPALQALHMAQGINPGG